MKNQFLIPGLTRVRAGILACALLTCALLMMLAACSGAPGSLKNISFNPKVDALTLQGDGSSGGTTTAGRSFECTAKAADGSCLANKCTQGPGGETYDCASFAAACVNAGEHYSGTKEGGTCSKVL